MTSTRTFESEQEERATLIQEILDKVNPFPEDASREDQEAIDLERQVLVSRAGWASMPIEKLRQVAHP